MQAGTEGVADSASIALLEGQLTWLCHIVAAIIRGPYMNSTGDSQVPIPLHDACHFCLMHDQLTLHSPLAKFCRLP